MYFYLTAHLRPKSKVRGPMTCDLRPDGPAICDLRLLRSAPAPLSLGPRSNSERPALWAGRSVGYYLTASTMVVTPLFGL